MSEYKITASTINNSRLGDSRQESSEIKSSRAFESVTVDTSRVFVIHGRDTKRKVAMFDFLRAIGLRPIEWSQARSMTGKGAPYIGEILEVAFGQAQAVVALLTGDDEARLLPELHEADEQTESLRRQPRANVLFEAGIAMGTHPERTVFVEVGHLRPFSDFGGRHSVRFSSKPSVENRQEIAMRLRDAGCAVDISGTDWHTSGDF